MKKSSCTPEDYYTLYLQQKSLMMHDRRIKNVQSTLRGILQSSQFSSMHVKKQPLAQLNRLLQIQTENQALLKKLTHQNKSSLSHSKSHKLLKNNRKKVYEEHEMNIANNGLAKRLKQAKSSYQCHRFAEERKKTERFLEARTKMSQRNKQKMRILVQNEKNEQKKHNFEQFLPQNHCHSRINNSSHKNICENNKIKQLIEFRKIMIREGDKTKVAFLKGLICESTCVFQINLKNKKSDTYKLTISNQNYENNYGGMVENLIKSIKYDKQNDEMVVDTNNSLHI